MPSFVFMLNILFKDTTKWLTHRSVYIFVYCFCFVVITLWKHLISLFIYFFNYYIFGAWWHLWKVYGLKTAIFLIKTCVSVCLCVSIYIQTLTHPFTLYTHISLYCNFCQCFLYTKLLMKGFQIHKIKVKTMQNCCFNQRLDYTYIKEKRELALEDVQVFCVSGKNAFIGRSFDGYWFWWVHVWRSV